MNLPVENSLHSNVALFAATNFRNGAVRFGIKPADRRAHLYLVGKTGAGKSTLLETLLAHDIRNGRGCCLLDPHGDLAERVLARVPASRQGDVIHLDAPDPSQPFGFNPIANVPVGRRPLAASGLLSVFRHLWADSWGPRLEHILRNTILLLLDQPEATLADALRLPHDARFRAAALKHSMNEQVTEFWATEFENYPKNFRAEAVAPVQNKVGAFLAHPVLSRILTRPQTPLRLRQIMDQGQILIVNLAKGKLGEDAANLLGSLLVSRFHLAALSRADAPEEERRDYHLYLDEFHSFTTLALAPMLAELRKYRLSLTLANQHLTQLSPVVRDAITGNVGTLIAFRLGAADAELLAPEFAPVFTASDLTGLPNRHIYLRLMIDGRVSEPFSAVTLAPDSS